MTAQQLKNSILQMAVQGKLVPQNPDDEPASVLLERIREEKEKLIKEEKIKKEKNLSYIFKGDDKIHYEKVGKNPPVSIEDELPFEIPESWEWVRLKEITCKEIKRGKSPKYSNKGNILVFAQKCNVKSGGINLSLAKLLDENMLSKYPNDEFMEDFDIIVNSTGTGTLGRIGIFRNSDNFLNKKIVPDSHVTIVRTGVNFSSEFLYYCMKYYQPILEEKGEGSTNQKELKPKTIKDLYIPVPPLKEQQRIVGKIEALFPYIEKYEQSETQLTKLNSNFPDKLKKSILQQAVQGKLVPQEPSDEPASVLLERIRAEKQQLIKDKKIKKDKNESVIFKRDNKYYELINGVERCIDGEIPFDIPDSWEWCRWGSIAESIQYGYNSPALDNGAIKMVRISDIQNNQVLWNNVPYCNINKNDIDTYLLKKNDILFARTGGTVGKSYLVKDVPCKAIYAGYLIRTRYSVNLCPKYLKRFMESSLYWIQLKNGTTTTAQPNCNGKTLANMLIPIPPFAEQQRIVGKIEDLLKYCEML